MVKRGRRKRRRTRIIDHLSNMTFDAIIGSTKAEIKLPTSLDECPRYILNAITTRLPLKARMIIFGHAIPIVLHGVVYRHKKLTWIVKHMYGTQLYLSCHLLADTIHLCEGLRNELPCRPQKKYNRQSFNAATFLYANVTDYHQDTNRIPLTTLGVSILQFNASMYDFRRILEFIDGRDHTQNILYHPILRDDTSLAMYTQTHIASLRGWKTFAPTNNNTGKCRGGKRRPCPCQRVRDDIQRQPHWNIVTLLQHVPTTIGDLSLPSRRFETFRTGAQ